MADPRIIDLVLDRTTIVRRRADIEQEQQVAVTDLLAENYFAPARGYPEGYGGPFRVGLRVQEGRLAIDIDSVSGDRLETQILSLARFRRSIKDYFAICESYFRAVRQATAEQLETVDMARRGLHDEAATVLRECLAGKIAIDFDTARRLFTLICVLHIRA